ncbi:hypothetical protein CBL_04450 [Carabus blaptoides fortunei]
MIQIIGLTVLLFLPQYWTLPGNELPQALPGDQLRKASTISDQKRLPKSIFFKKYNQIEDKTGQDDGKSVRTVLPEVTSVLPSVTSALPNVTTALPSVTSALPNVTTALPSVTNSNRTDNSTDLETAETFYKGGGGGCCCCNQQPTYVQPVHVQPVYVKPVYVQPVYVQPVAQHRPRHHHHGGGKGGGGAETTKINPFCRVKQFN